MVANIQQWEWTKESFKSISKRIRRQPKNNAVEEYWPSNATSLADFEADIKKILSQAKPEPIVDSAPYDRDLTTEEIEKLERNTIGNFIVKRKLLW